MKRLRDKYPTAAALVYGLTFASAGDARQNCELRNDQIAEVNLRTGEINSMAEALADYMIARLAGQQALIAEGTPVVRRTVRRLNSVNAESVATQDCDQTFPYPWPFG